MAVSMKFTFFWDIALYGTVSKKQTNDTELRTASIIRMIGRMILILIIALMMETVNTSKMLNYFYKTYRVQYPEGCHLKKMLFISLRY
jgi:hypothetical protein